MHRVLIFRSQKAALFKTTYLTQTPLQHCFLNLRFLITRDQGQKLKKIHTKKEKKKKNTNSPAVAKSTLQVSTGIAALPSASTAFQNFKARHFPIDTTSQSKERISHQKKQITQTTHPPSVAREFSITCMTAPNNTGPGPLNRVTCLWPNLNRNLDVAVSTIMTKYALITGASSGIGYQMALALHKRGYTIIGISPERDLWGMKPLEQQIGLIPLALDITKPKDVEAAAEKVRQITGGTLDILYNNAGISNLGGPAIEYDDDKLRLLFDVNVLGHMYVTKYFSDLVIKAKGTIVFTSSVAARVPLSWVSAYNATKAAIDQYALTLRGELKPLGVKVHSVITGGVDTAICDPLSTPTLLTEHYDVPGVYESILASANMSRNPRTSISAQKYANQVAGQITKKRDVGFNIYRGSRAYLLHFLRFWCPLWICELGIQWHFKQFLVLRAVARLAKKRKLE